jgi:hypothetical protein
LPGRAAGVGIIAPHRADPARCAVASAGAVAAALAALRARHLLTRRRASGRAWRYTIAAGQSGGGRNQQEAAG